eukprot:TRINITY_DN690_c0_g1_i1.p2 TRINITY_DN690_c0_g1~~TRINITY_DN690_c0_g1_i1.p2  ORF type:complete len:147 (-),score=11.27 TRINITY_DN690_c0_g1_i1:158-574(-)
MAFLRHDGAGSPQDAVLIDREGGTHVKGRVYRINQQPGGNSTLSLSDGSRESPFIAAPNRVPRAENKENSFPPKQPTAPAPVAQEPIAKPAPAIREASPANGPPAQYTTLLCTEGGQLRNRPARKVVQPPGGASSIVF